MNEGQFKINLTSLTNGEGTPVTYEYKDVGSNWEIEAYRDGKLLATFIANKGIKGSISGFVGGTRAYDFSKLDDVKFYFDLQINPPTIDTPKGMEGFGFGNLTLTNKVYFDKNGILREELSDLETEINKRKGIDNKLNELSAFKIKYPPQASLTTPQTASLPAIEISAPGYESVEIIPYKGDGTVKTDLGVIPLIPTNVALEKDKIKASQLDPDQIKELSKPNKNSDYLIQEQLSNQILDLKKTLIPSVLTMVAAFGITGASTLISKNQNKILDIINNKSNCPSEEKLTSLINKKNKLVKQLNNSLKIIDSTTKALGITTELISLLNLNNQSSNNALLAIPTSTGAPGVPGLSVGIITQLDDAKDNNKNKIQTLTKISAGVLSILFLLRQTLTQATQLLQLLDQLIQKCYPDTEQEQISTELTNLTKNQSFQQSPVVINVNGFKMNVETEITDKPLKRRRATATNKQNVVMLRGEWSFSSIDQILIDELVFYIEQNNLKTD
jgi:hypothetical protein